MHAHFTVGKTGRTPGKLAVESLLLTLFSCILLSFGVSRVIEDASFISLRGVEVVDFWDGSVVAAPEVRSVGRL